MAEKVRTLYLLAAACLLLSCQAAESAAPGSPRAELLLDTGRIQAAAGRPQIAYKYFMRAAGVAKSGGNTYSEGIAYGELGYLLKNCTLADDAVEMFRKKIRLYKQNGKADLLWDSYVNLGWIFVAGGNSSEALEEFNNALVIARRKDNEYRKAVCLFEIGKLLYQSGEYQLANEYMSGAFLYFFPNNKYRELAAYYTEMGVLLSAKGSPEEAEAMLERSAALIREHGLSEWIAEQHKAEGIVNQSVGRMKQAEAAFRSGMEAFLAKGDTLSAIKMAGLLEGVYIKSGNEAGLREITALVHLCSKAVQRSRVPVVTEMKLAMLLHKIEDNPAASEETVSEALLYGWVLGGFMAAVIVTAVYLKRKKPGLPVSARSGAAGGDARNALLKQIPEYVTKMSSDSAYSDFCLVLHDLETYLKTAPVPPHLGAVSLDFFEDRLKPMQKEHTELIFDMDRQAGIRTDRQYMLLLLEAVLRYYHVAAGGGKAALITDIDSNGEVVLFLRSSGESLLALHGTKKNTGPEEGKKKTGDMASYLIKMLCAESAAELRSEIAIEKNHSGGSMIRISNIGKL